jgi:UDP-GlcNAc:undecaprenyl-phosphate/decaprenyl-phosphate GlcNAc-1-phosphate transferase
MDAILVLGITAFFFCLILTPLCRDLFLRLNFVDRPDADRKLHRAPVPRLGGVPIVLSYVGALGLMLLLGPATAGIYIAHKQLLLSLLPATGLVFITGVADDIIGLKPWQKLVGQIIAGLLAISRGAILSGIDGHPASVWVTVPLSLVWLIACTNALNLIDGIDGLAAGVGLLATVTTLIAAIFSHNPGLAAATVPLVGCLLAFLYYNFNPASIFLGDCGSLTIGFMLGCFGLIWSQHSGGMLGIAAPLMTLALPLIDVCLSIGRRYLRSAPIFKGDRGHIHHMIVARGFNQRAAALILYGVCVIAAMFALMERFGGYQYHTVVIVLFCILVCVGVNYLGYVEIAATRRALSRKTVLGAVKQEVFLQQFAIAADKMHTVEDCWKVILALSRYMQFTTVEMQMDGYAYSEVLAPEEDGDHSWSLVLPLGADGNLSVTGSTTNHPPAFMMRALVDLQYLLKDKVLQVSDTRSEAVFQDAAMPLPPEHVNLAEALHAAGSQTADAA